MMNLRSLSQKLSAATNRWLVYSVLAFSLIGFLDAVYLAAKHYLGTPLNCSLFEGCDAVTTSAYSAIAGVPLALLGAFYYLGILLLVVAYLDTGREYIFGLAARLTVFGFAVSLLLVYLQLFVIRAICIYCMVSAVSSTILFILGVLAIKLRRKQEVVL